MSARRTRTLRWLVPLIALSSLLGATGAHAQGAPGEAKVMTAAPDVVRLKNGGLLRGTISELVPGGSVVIVTATGDVRRVDMSEVEYAGPAGGAAAAAPATAPPSTPPPAGHQAIHLTASHPQITFHQRIAASQTTGASVGFGVGIGGGGGGGAVGISPYAATSATYAPLCLAPCDLAMAPGTYYLGLSLEDGGPVSDNRPVVIAPGTTQLVGSYKSYAPVRNTGWAIGAASFAVGVGISAWALITGAQACANTGCIVPEDRVAPLSAGIGVLLGGALVGYVLSSFDDEVSVVAQ